MTSELDRSPFPDGYRPLSEDTEPWAERLLFERWRAMSPEQKLELAHAGYVAQHLLSLAGLRARHPRASERELELRAAILRYGREFMARMLGAAALPPHEP